MSTKKNHKKGPAQQPPSGYNHFLTDLNTALELIEFENDLSVMSSEQKRMMYRHNLHIKNPVAGNQNITSGELKIIAEKTKLYYRERSFEYEHKFLSNYQLQILYCYSFVKARAFAKEIGDKNHPDVVLMDGLADSFLEVFFIRYAMDFFRAITQLSNPDQKYYGVNIRPAAIFKDNPQIELITEIYGIPAQKLLLNINGNKRPAFQMAKADPSKPIKWITVNVSLLKGHYTGNLTQLDVYIQSHALRRLSERLDLLDHEAINYALWDNTKDVQYFKDYRGFLLLPFKILDVKVGYLAAKVFHNKLLFRTFLFIVHNGTPEGDRLQKISGLGKEDISYWHIDRLSTFVNMDKEKQPALCQLFREAGLEDMMKLKKSQFHSDSLQTANLNGLYDYIQHGWENPKPMVH
jgi:hypothetical protein